jgi:Domain of unknown function (DUF1707)
MALISDRDRENATAALRRHYASGTLSIAELNERLQIALSARRRSELAPAFRELPPMWLVPTELYRLGEAATMRGRRFASRVLFLAKVAMGWLMVNLLLLFGFIAVATVHGLSLLEACALPLAWLVTTLLAFRIARR